MGKKNKGKDKKKPSWKEYVSDPDKKAWKKKSDYKASERKWNQGRMQARNPAGYDAFKNREAAYKDRIAAEKARKEAERKRPAPQKSGSGGRFNPDRGTGEYSDIKAALKYDTQLGFDAASDFQNRGVPGGSSDFNAQQTLGTSNPFTTVSSSMNVNESQRNIAALLGIRNIDSQNDLNQITQAQNAAQALGINNIDSQNDIRQIQEYLASNPQPGSPSDQSPLSDLLIQQSDQFNTEIAGLKSGYDQQISALTGQLSQANNAYTAAQNLMQQQLNSATAARNAAEQRATNMRNAFVPQANPTALSVLYGDARKTDRDRNQNQLSDLKILSGLGTASNPLAGLQLA